jgi:hypothetical protein
MVQQGTTVDPDADKLFQNPAIISVLRDVFFQKASSAGILNMSSFVSAHKTRLEPELPNAMIALVGAAVSSVFVCVRVSKLIVCVGLLCTMRVEDWHSHGLGIYSCFLPAYLPRSH